MKILSIVLASGLIGYLMCALLTASKISDLECENMNLRRQLIHKSISQNNLGDSE